MPLLLLIFALVAAAANAGGGHFDAHRHRETDGPRNIIIVEEAIECELGRKLRLTTTYKFGVYFLV